MADDTDTPSTNNNSGNQQPQKGGVTGASLLKQIEAEVRKSQADAVKNQLKELTKQKLENDKTGKLIQEKISKIVEDFDADLT